jgi:hypothetical protein
MGGRSGQGTLLRLTTLAGELQGCCLPADLGPSHLSSNLLLSQPSTFHQPHVFMKVVFPAGHLTHCTQANSSSVSQKSGPLTCKVFRVLAELSQTHRMALLLHHTEVTWSGPRSSSELVQFPVPPLTCCEIVGDLSDTANPPSSLPSCLT